MTCWQPHSNMISYSEVNYLAPSLLQTGCPQKCHAWSQTPKQAAVGVPWIQDCACEVSEIFEDGRGILQLQKLFLFVLEEREGEAKYDLWGKMIKAVKSAWWFSPCDRLPNTPHSTHQSGTQCSSRLRTRLLLSDEYNNIFSEHTAQYVQLFTELTADTAAE